jgi:hypothetical protein
MSTRVREYLKLIAIGLLTMAVDLAVDFVFEVVLPTDGVVPRYVRVFPLAAVLALGMLAMFRLAQKRKADGTYIWSDRDRLVVKSSFWFSVASMAIAAVYVCVRLFIVG